MTRSIWVALGMFSDARGRLITPLGPSLGRDEVSHQQRDRVLYGRRASNRATGGGATHLTELIANALPMRSAAIVEAN